MKKTMGIAEVAFSAAIAAGVPMAQSTPTLTLDQLGRKHWQSIDSTLRPAELDDDAPACYVPLSFEPW